jgi:hypothetical protein
MDMGCECHDNSLFIVYLWNFGIGLFHCQKQVYWCYVTTEYSA